MGSAIIIPNIANGESTGPELNPTDESLGRVTSDSACCAAADLLGWSLMPQSTFNERLGRLDGGDDDQAPGGKQAIVEWRKHVPLSPDVDEQLESSHVLDLLLEIAKWHSLVNDGPLDRDNT
ncbi:hypothetical protein ASPCAL14655 [Aspergillus calidoustus]|uniref:Uncharacterized protein n=1 Tax=Aspergillus calidoustus TaxID=454130 RepID=A0A0U5GGG4_ASPCI|nr:hypothetical protein ASPCAL14655 [Aspergillus calidoustus]